MITNAHVPAESLNICYKWRRCKIMGESDARSGAQRLGFHQFPTHYSMTHSLVVSLVFLSTDAGASRSSSSIRQHSSLATATDAPHQTQFHSVDVVLTLAPGSRADRARATLPPCFTIKNHVFLCTNASAAAYPDIKSGSHVHYFITHSLILSGVLHQPIISLQPSVTSCSRRCSLNRSGRQPRHWS